MVYDDDKPVGCCIYGRGRDEDYGDWCEIVSLYLQKPKPAELCAG